MRVSTCGTHDAAGIDAGIDSVVSVHSGCGAAALACDDDSTACGTLDAGIFRDSLVELPLSPLQTVLIRVANFGTGNALGGSFRLNVGYDPANETCATAQVIGGSFVTTTNNSGSANESDAQTGACNSGVAGIDNSIWYTFNAARGQPVGHYQSVQLRRGAGAVPRHVRGVDRGRLLR